MYRKNNDIQVYAISRYYTLEKLHIVKQNIVKTYENPVQIWVLYLS